MFRTVVRCNVQTLFRQFTTNKNDIIPTTVSTLSVTETLKNEISASEDKKTEIITKKTSTIKPKRINLSEISKVLRPGAISSIYVNKSEILQELIKLGVRLYEIEKDPEAIKFILGLKFDDIKDTIIFLKELGIETEVIGNIITKNPFILRENLEDLKVRINYLQYKRFTDEMILRIVSNNPLWLTFSTADIDNRLGFFQNTYSLTGNEVRMLAVKCPKLITYSLEKIKLNNFTFREEMGFTAEEFKTMILKYPELLKHGQYKSLQTFEYFHNEMNIPLERIVETPEILYCRQHRLKQRHLFLVKLGKDQYNPKKPNYISLKTLVSGTDAYFSTEVAESSAQLYNHYLKTL